MSAVTNMKQEQSKEDQLGFWGVTGLLASIPAGAVVSAFAVAIGARITGGAFSAYDLSPLVYGICAAGLSIPISSIWIMVWRWRSREKIGTLVGVPLAIVPMFAFFTGLALSPIRHFLER